jgi:hypothetical protein
MGCSGAIADWLTVGTNSLNAKIKTTNISFSAGWSFLFWHSLVLPVND